MGRAREAGVLALLLAGCAHARPLEADGLAAGAPHPLVHQRAPSVSIVDIDGAILDSARLDGKVTVVHFFATWADASRATLPKLEELYERYHRQGVEIVALSVDDDGLAVSDFARTYGARFTVAWDQRKDVVRHWLVRHVPCSFVVDRHGVVRAAFVGAHDGFEVEIETDLKILAAADAPHLAGPPMR